MDIRPARMEDHAAVSAFTRATFSWGDYVPQRYKDWIADKSGLVLVAVDDSDSPVALAKIALLSPDEAWASAARVHPDYRRRGLATELSTQLSEWAAERGAQVVRLAVEEWNEAARAQVTAMGFRRVSDWFRADRAIGAASPVPEGNGGRRVPAAERLRKVPSSEAEPAYLSWATGPLSHAARGLFPTGWNWRRLMVDDLAGAARRDAFWEGQPGWAVADVGEDSARVSWLEVAPDDAYSMARALVDLAADAEAEQLEVFAPDLDWLNQALRRVGCKVLPISVYAKPLG